MDNLTQANAPELMLSDITGIRQELGLTGNWVRLLARYFAAKRTRPRLTLAAFGRMSGLCRGHMSKIMQRACRAGLTVKVGREWQVRLQKLVSITSQKAMRRAAHMRRAIAKLLKRKPKSDFVTRHPTHTASDDQKGYNRHSSTVAELVRAGLKPHG